MSVSEAVLTMQTNASAVTPDLQAMRDAIDTFRHAGLKNLANRASTTFSNACGATLRAALVA